MDTPAWVRFVILSAKNRPRSMAFVTRFSGGSPMERSAVELDNPGVTYTGAWTTVLLPDCGGGGRHIRGREPGRSSGSLWPRDRASQEAAGRNEDLVDRLTTHGDKGRRAVFRVDQRGQTPEPSHHVEQIDRFLLANGIDGARSITLIGQSVEASGHPLELVYCVQPQNVHPRFPLQDVSIDINRFAGDLEELRPSVGIGHAGAEALRPDRPGPDRGGDLLVGQGPIPADRDGDGGKKRRQSREEEGCQTSGQHALPASPACRP